LTRNQNKNKKERVWKDSEKKEIPEFSAFVDNIS
jgi:hypothetical protein